MTKTYVVALMIVGAATVSCSEPSAPISDTRMASHHDLAARARDQLLTRSSAMDSIPSDGVDTCSQRATHAPCSAACGENKARLTLPVVTTPEPYKQAVASGCGGNSGGGSLTCDAREKLLEQLVCARDTEGRGNVMP